MLCNSLAEVTLLFVKKGFKLVESDYKDTGEVFFLASLSISDCTLPVNQVLN